MNVELRPLGVKCNIHCHYCYQNPQRDAGNLLHDYDLDKMKGAVEREGGPFTLFGGEPLLVPGPDLDALFAWGHAKYGGNNVQTNGTLIDDEHIARFKKYKVAVGISVDGPAELNDVRAIGSLKQTREATAKTHRAIERMCKEGISLSLIVTLHRGNATRDKLPIMHDWFRYLERIGVRSARLHILEVEYPAIVEKYGLTPAENCEAFLSFEKLEREELTTLSFDLFGEMRSLLLGQDERTTCIWNACDPLTTRAVRGVEGNGQSSNCGRTNKDGIDFVKSDREGFERYLALYHTPQQHEGCNGCRFFLMCKGHCPGTAVNGDWRNRTMHCEVWKSLFCTLEGELLDAGQTPLSARPERKEVEQLVLSAWASGRYLSIALALAQVEARATASGAGGATAGNAPHSDSPHGDSHGDHTDAALGRPPSPMVRD